MLPQGVLSRLAGRLARFEFPPLLQARINRGFARLVGIDAAEAECPPDVYPSLSALFVRRLRPGARAWPEDPLAPASPVDAVLGMHGPFDDGTVFQAKGRTYGVGSLLGDEAGERFQCGCFFTLYLSPRHYHRVHAPASGRVISARVEPGRLFPVNAAAVASIDDLFPRNERLIVVMETERHHIAVVAIGALNVGSISAAFDPEWRDVRTGGVTNLSGARPAVPRQRTYDPPLDVRQGQELMVFHLGSTVVMLVSARDGRPGEPSELRSNEDVESGQDIRVGAPLLS